MNNKSRSIVLSILAIVATIMIINFMKPEEEVSEAKKEAYSKTVRTEAVVLGNHFAEVDFSGKIQGEEKLELFSEVPGVLLSDNFKEGVQVAKGQSILLLESSELSNALKAQRSNLITQLSATMGDLKIDFPNESGKWEALLGVIDVNKNLPALPEVEDAKLKRFLSGKGIYNSYFNIKSQEEKLQKFNISAPFDGVITLASVNKGTLVRAGQKVGEFLKPNLFEFETEVSLSDLAFIKVGFPLELKSDELKSKWIGKVTRINSVIESNSQMVKIYASVTGNDLKEGMYLYGTVKGTEFENTVVVNRKLVNNGGVYTVKDGVIALRKIEVLYANQSVAIIKGLENGELLVADNMKGLFEGLKVEIKN